MGEKGFMSPDDSKLSLKSSWEFSLHFTLFLKRCDCSVLRALSRVHLREGKKTNLDIFVNALRLFG